MRPKRKKSFVVAAMMLSVWAASAALLVPGASAAPSELLQIAGLTFRCPGCRIRPDGLCEIARRNETITMTCPEAAEELLSTSAPDSYDGEHPSPAELAAFLQTVKEQPSTAIHALALLLSTPPGISLFRDYAGTLEAAWCPQLLELLAHRRVPDDAIEVIWRVPGSAAGCPDQVHLAAAAASSALGLEDLLADDLARHEAGSAEELRSWASFLDSLTAIPKANVWSETLKLTANMLDRCSNVWLHGEPSDRCTSGAIESFPEAVRPYLRRVQLSQAVSYAQKEPNPSKALRGMASADYEHSDTPAFQTLVAKQLRLAAAASETTVEAALNDESIRALSGIVASRNADVARSFALLLVQSAKNAATAGDYVRAVDRLEDSYLVESVRFDERRAVLLSLFERLSALPEDVQVRTKRLCEREHLNCRSDISSYAISAGVLAVLGAGIWFAARRRKHRVVKHSNLTMLERQELREIYRMLRLPPHTTLEELTRFYYQRAKELHPDLNDSPNVDELTAIREHYERAKELLAKRKG